MKHRLIFHPLAQLIMLLAITFTARAQHVGSPIGFASVADYGISQLTGGAGGEVVIINGQADAKKMQDALDDDDTPKIIYLYGTVTFPEYPNGVGPVSDESDRMTMVRSNKTILGMGPDATIKDSGLSIYSGSGEGPDAQLNGVHNVIIQNVNFTGALDDALNIQGGSHHIWVDHCTFSDGYDGLLDVKRGSDYVTVSHNLFTNHGKMSLVGHSSSSDIVAIDQGHLRVTYHHNWFNDQGSNIRSSRHPRVRTGDVHVFNNYYSGREDATMDYAVASNAGADVVVENNYMLNVKRPAERGYAGESEGDLVFNNNIVINNLYPPMAGGTAFNPSALYSYSMMPAEDVPAYVTANAGAGKINVPAPGEEDNTTYYSLSTTVNGQGSISPNGGSYSAGSTVYLTANPANGWEFSGWSGAVSGTSNPASLTMNGNKQITATFTEVDNGGNDNGGGDAGGGDNGGTLALGDNLSITGPGPGADGSGKASGTSYGNVIDGNTSSIWGATGTSNQNVAVKWSSDVTANTVIIREVGNNITSWKLETAGGATLATGTTVGSEKLIQFDPATESKFRFVILGANANPQISEFEVYNATGSTGTDNGSNTYQLSTSVNGQGTVTPASGTFNEGETVTLTATEAAGWQFNGWSGDVSGTTNPLTLTMNGNKSVTASFIESSENDCIIISLEAEEGSFSSGSIDSNHSGFSGSGFVNTDNAAGEWLDFTVNAANAGNADVTVKYADGKTDERSISVSVNGNEVIPYLNMPQTGSWSTWTEVAFSVNLTEGNNTIRLTALNSGGLPNIDKADACVTGGGSGNPEPVSFQLVTSANGQGTVTPASGTFNEGETVTLTATPASGWSFGSWSGDASGSANPLSIGMNSSKNITANFIQNDGGSTPPPSGTNDGPIGFAAMAGGTTGGAGGTTVTVSTGTELQNAIKNKGSQPLTIYVNGTITPSNSSGLSKIDVKEVSDVSILGLGSGAEFNGIGIKVNKSSNIIIRNLKIHHVNIGDKDCISIEGPADHVWVDHCELYNEYQGVGKDYYDGLLDAKRDAYYITFSYNYLHDSWKAALSGSGDSDNYDRQITYHHNYFENINSRLPLFRFGTGHVFNNYYKGVESTAINSRMGACVKIENNYFENVTNPWVSAYSNEDGYGDISGNQLVNSFFDYSSDTRELQSCSASIPYAYSQNLISANQVPAYVMANAGVGKINISPQTIANARTKGSSLLEVSDQAGETFKVYPNPYEGASAFEIHLAEKGQVRISLFNLQGNKIAIVADQVMEAGKNSLRYENSSIQPGIYFYLLETEEGSFRRKILVK